MPEATPRYPGRAPIEAYGNGGFRFAGMSHRGSIICLPDGIIAWSAVSVGDVTVELIPLLRTAGVTGGVILLGTGRTQVYPGSAALSAFREAGLWLEVLDTGAAARTYNVLLAEERDVSALLLAVD
ncbi:MAG: Mth938-like domain-containing protein [Deltaproteobacteria bacterium]